MHMTRSGRVNANVEGY